MVLGNHDNTGYVGGDGAGNARGMFQVDSCFDGKLSNRWNMPDRYYQHSAGTTTLGGARWWNLTAGFQPHCRRVCRPGYCLRVYLCIDQRNWAVNAIGSSNAVFKIAMAHHPYLSNGRMATPVTMMVCPVKFFRCWLVTLESLYGRSGV